MNIWPWREYELSECLLVNTVLYCLALIHFIRRHVTVVVAAPRRKDSISQFVHHLLGSWNLRPPRYLNKVSPAAPMYVPHMERFIMAGMNELAFLGQSRWQVEWGYSRAKRSWNTSCIHIHSENQPDEISYAYLEYIGNIMYEYVNGVAVHLRCVGGPFPLVFWISSLSALSCRRMDHFTWLLWRSVDISGPW